MISSIDSETTYPFTNHASKQALNSIQPTTTTIRFPNPSGTISVQVCGNWDEWKSRIPLKYSSHIDAWTCSVTAPPGTYQCKFLVNNEHWVVTNLLPMTADETGNNNNIISIRSDSRIPTDPSESAGITREDFTSHSSVVPPDSSYLLSQGTQETDTQHSSFPQESMSVNQNPPEEIHSQTAKSKMRKEKRSEGMCAGRCTIL